MISPEDRVVELIKELRELAAQSNGGHGVYFEVGNGAYLASAFEDLDELLKGGAKLPEEWRER